MHPLPSIFSSALRDKPSPHTQFSGSPIIHETNRDESLPSVTGSGAGRPKIPSHRVMAGVNMLQSHDVLSPGVGGCRRPARFLSGSPCPSNLSLSVSVAVGRPRSPGSVVDPAVAPTVSCSGPRRSAPSGSVRGAVDPTGSTRTRLRGCPVSPRVSPLGLSVSVAS